MSSEFCFKNMSLPWSFVPFFWFLVCLKRSENPSILPPRGRIEVKTMDLRSISAIWLVISETCLSWANLCDITLILCYLHNRCSKSPSVQHYMLFHICHFVFSPVQIRPYVGCLVQYLPLLWKQSEEHNMLRCAILTTLIHLVQVWRDPCRQ